MHPDLIFLAGVIVLALAFPATLAAFSSSNRTFRPVILCILVGGGLVFAAVAQTPSGYSINDVPRIVADLVN